MKWKTIILIVVIIGVLVGGYFGITAWQKAKAASSTTYQTAVISRDDLTALVGSTGTVHANQTAVLTWQTSGQIEKINAQLGRTVYAEQALAYLKKSTLNQSLILAEADLISAKKALADLKDNELLRAQAQVNLLQAQQALTDAQKERERLKYQRASDETIENAYATTLMAQNNVEAAEEIYKIFENRAEDDPDRLAALSARNDAIIKYNRTLANYNALKKAPDNVEVATADANIELAQAKYDQALEQWDLVKDGPNAEDIRMAEVRILAIEASLDSMYLRAPFAGTITEVRSKVGDQVSPGTVTFRIDDFSHLLVDVQIPEVDINDVKVGQDVSLSFDAIADKEYHGKVTSVASVGTAVQGVVNYTVTVELLDPDEDVLSGMTAAVNIVINKVEDVLAVPNRAVRLRDGQRVVYILRNGEPVMVKVELGAISDLQSEIVSGDVNEGDLVILNPPSDTSSMFGGPGR